MGRSGSTKVFAGSSIPQYFSNASANPLVGDRIFNIACNGSSAVYLYDSNVGIVGKLVMRIPEGAGFTDFGEAGITCSNACYISTSCGAVATSISITGVTEIL